MTDAIDSSLPVDVIRIEKIIARGKHGVTEAEREQCLPLELSVELRIDLTKPGQTDDIDDTVNYSTLHRTIVGIVETKSRNLLERLAEDVIEVTFQDKRVRQATVWIGKPERLGGATPSVTLVRRNN